MTYSRTFITKTLSAVVITCAVAAFYTAPVAAQTASRLNCGGCVKSKQIKNGGVKNKDLQDNAVNGQKIADGTVGNADLGGDSVTSDKVLDESLGASDLGTNSVNSDEIAAGAVGSSEVSGNSIPSTDLSNEAGADFAGGNQSVTLTSTDVTVRSVTISAPSSGKVIVNASGFFDLNSAGNDVARCSITLGTTIDQNALIIYNDSGAVGHTGFVPFAATRGFNVGAGTTTFRLVCDEFAGDTEVQDTHLTAMFFPTTY